ncbi:hypothetical protein RHGRI_031044 [Rhododendron griersonianum]|uniref:Transposase n=1 Tax=Rhododendron griersonianum TaxID=479676 RepID=A0AAV6I6U1_9ERIC|nr:hypothetical protein RHGRI_031044 [Rhododendron griersonianum]
MMGSARLQCSNDNGKRGRADQVDDPDYILSNDQDGHGYNKINRPTRGATQGIQAQGLIDKQRKLPVPIPQLSRAPIGKHAAQLASRIGVEVRTHVIDLGVPRWKVVDESVKAPILQRIMDKFDLQGDPIDVEKVVAMQCGWRLSNHNFVLHKKYKKLKETRGEEYARNNPPAGVNPEQWTSLVTKKWTVPKWLMQNNGGVVPAVTEMYKSTHFNEDTQKWISSESEVLYDKMVQIETEHNAQEGAIPIMQEALSVKGFKARSGYVKGLGIKPSSSIRIVNGEYVTHLEGKVQEQAEKIQEQAEKIQEQVEGIEAANIKIDELRQAKEEQGKTLASVMAFIKQQGFIG